MCHTPLQARYAAGTREILEAYLDGKPIVDAYYIVKDGRLAGAGAHAYTSGNVTGGSDQVSHFLAGAGPDAAH